MLTKMFTRKAASQVSLFLGDRQVVICVQQHGKKTLLAKKLISAEAEWEKAFLALVAKHNLAGSRFSVVLSREFYQTFDIDKPKADESELLASLPFSIKDLVSGSVFDLVVDYFDMPLQQRKGEQITTICVPKERVLRIRDMVLNAGCKLQGISIQELALARLLGEHSEANILLSQHHNELILTVVKEGQLYFNHRLRGFNDLLPLPLEQVEDTLVDGLSLEIQRALDYVSSQLRINTVGVLYMALVCPDLKLLSEKLGAYLARDVRPYGEEGEYDYLSIIAYGGLTVEHK